MDKFGVIRPGQTPSRGDNEKTTEDLDACLEKQAAEVAQKRCSETKQRRDA